MKRILFIFGTRPEAIKLAPVIMEFRRHPDSFDVKICVTAQHRQMLDQVMEVFDLRADFDLDLMQEKQSLLQLSGRVFSALESVLVEVKPDWVFIQGDTTTVMAAGVAAFYFGCKIAHVEAGLRSHNRFSPFPEEINRRIASVVADLHFAPTETARKALIAEGIDEKIIHVTGNTVIDALLWVRERVRQHPPQIAAEFDSIIGDRRMILVTGHRRESFGEGFEQICLALKDIAEEFNDVIIVYPVHLNPHVREPVNRVLGAVKNVRLIEPLQYTDFVWMMDRSFLIITDSGGVQEEAPSLGKPILVMRDVTERMEGVEAGTAKLVGAKRPRIVGEARLLLTDTTAYEQMAKAGNPYGDGNASQRISNMIRQHHRSSRL
ncbi:MAG: UDP-N-acetylglucosamine 2-epimerase (non-hydrolyzing) [Bacteroidetes bacterium]|nr:UDP-N-acetylglucosamine 2-epimerase (non-hydrolyzing) [Bacteroidota bacterium]